MAIKSKLFIKQRYMGYDLNQLFHFYKKIWLSTFAELGTSKLSLVEDFHRFDVKVGFFDDNRPVAFHGYQFFDLNLVSDCEHAYFKQVEVPIVDSLIKRNITKLATLEYMCICPEYKKNHNPKIGEILGGYSTQFFKNTDFDGVLTIARNGRGVNRMSKMYGAEALYEDLKLHNVEKDRPVAVIRYSIETNKAP